MTSGIHQHQQQQQRRRRLKRYHHHHHHHRRDVAAHAATVVVVGRLSAAVLLLVAATTGSSSNGNSNNYGNSNGNYLRSNSIAFISSSRQNLPAAASRSTAKGRQVTTTTPTKSTLLPYRKQKRDQQQQQRTSATATDGNNNNIVDSNNTDSKLWFFATPVSQSPPISVEEATTVPTSSSSSSSLSPKWVSGPPVETKPDYEDQVGPLGKNVDDFLMKLFCYQLRLQVMEEKEQDEAGGGGGGILKLFRDHVLQTLSGTGSNITANVDTYESILDLTKNLNTFYSNRTVIQTKAQNTLRALFPSWMPPQYAVLFSKPFPAFSSRMNAWATWVGGTWLMGDCEVNDIPPADLDPGMGTGKNQGLLVKRCRFLEESGCASVCVNSCKIPTQNFFLQDMGLPLTMEPNYTTHECQFSFGRTPNTRTEMAAIETPCLTRCPTNGSLRKYHASGGGSVSSSSSTTTATTGSNYITSASNLDQTNGGTEETTPSEQKDPSVQGKCQLIWWDGLANIENIK